MARSAVASGADLEFSLPVTGMTCTGCARRVERALRALPEVGSVSVNPALERAELRLVEGGHLAADRLAAAVRDAGFGVEEGRLALAITGMSCTACAGRVERALAAVPGVIEARVNPATERATVRYLPGATTVADLGAAVERAGYGLGSVEAGGAATPSVTAGPKAPAELIPLLVAAALTLPLVAPMVLAPLGSVHAHLPVWLELLLAAPVQFVIGARFYRGAWRALRSGAGNMDLLVALGTSSAFAYSLWLALAEGEAAAGRLYVEGSAAIITFVLLGKWLEARAKRGASSAVRALLELRPETAHLLASDGTVRDVPVGLVAVGDRVLVRPGERVPVDGRVERGESELDEALLTGESLPVARRAGGRVLAGSVNGTGVLELRALRIGGDTTLARVARLVEGAQAGKAPVQRLVDRLSAIFVPAVVVLAVATLVGWLLAGAGTAQAVAAAVSVLVIACPCALGLATPAALVAGMGAAARAGILIRDIETLERAPGVRTVVFDKTGTLTAGTPAVTEVRPAPGTAPERLLAVAAAAQRGSEHPVGRAILRRAEKEGLTPPAARGARALPGRGITAEVEGRAVVVGTERLLAEKGVDAAGSGLREMAEHAEGEGRTVVWVAEAGVVLGLLGLRDEPREGAAGAVARLRREGMRCTLLSGDNRRTAERVAAEVGIGEVRAPVMPDGKAAEIARLRQAGHGGVAMVGDGINDAPALAAADVGIAMAGGADVALESAGITLMRPDPGLVPDALEVARRTARKVRQNLVWAFAYNLVALPLAALGYLSPALAGAAMALSSVSVVANALLLRRWRPATAGVSVR